MKITSYSVNDINCSSSNINTSLEHEIETAVSLAKSLDNTLSNIQAILMQSEGEITKSSKEKLSNNYIN